jgi:nucleosome assembly protein 1-like 4
MKSEPNKIDNLCFEGLEIVDCDGCNIDWKKGEKLQLRQ